MRYVTKTFSLESNHAAVIDQVAKDHGASTKSAALRFIIDSWVAFVRSQANGSNGGQNRGADDAPATP